jgi:competence protein ComEC
MCDVGQGDALVITQGFSQMVVDTGQNNGELLHCLGEVLPFWDRTIELVMITHADADHFGALGEMAKRYDLDLVMTSPVAYDRVKRVVPDVEVRRGVAGQELRWGKIVGSVLWPVEPLPALKGLKPDNNNETGLVMRMVFPGGNSLWLSGDVGNVVERYLVDHAAVLQTTVLKVAHHGSASSSIAPFLEVLRPSQAWISVGANNRYGHPAAEVLERLSEVGTAIHRTDKQGMNVWFP